MDTESTFAIKEDGQRVIISASKKVGLALIKLAGSSTILTRLEFLSMLKANWAMPDSSNGHFAFEQRQDHKEPVEVVATMTLDATESTRRHATMLGQFWSLEETPFTIHFGSYTGEFEVKHITSFSTPIYEIAEPIARYWKWFGEIEVILGGEVLDREADIMFLTEV